MNIKLKCPNCEHQWSFPSEGYDGEISNIRDYSRILNEQQLRLCPQCGDRTHLPNSINTIPEKIQLPNNGNEPLHIDANDEASGEEIPLTKKEEYSFIAQAARFSLEKDVILPPSSKLQIDEALVKIRSHKIIYQDWGFEEVDPMGKGVILSFYGKPGTGKTLTAEAMAGTLGIPFLALGMADVESKFMGETAKNIKKTFVASREQGALLFFDEADTLLGKRLSSVTQGVDNEVNALRSTMLIELERFEGIIIFATNFAENYDKAFENRITQHVHFELPDTYGRELLWLKHLVAKIPIAETREELAKRAAEHTDGMVGRDMRTCLRLALPKALLEAERTCCDPVLHWDHLLEAIVQVKRAHREVGQEVNSRLSPEATQSTRQLLGLNQGV